MKRSSRNFEEVLASPWALWLISIAASVLMWVYVTGTTEDNYVTRRFDCPLEYRSLDPQSELRGGVSEVEVEIRGLEEAIARLNYDEIACFVDARNLTPGKRYTQNVNVSLPPGITLVSCVPSQVVLELVRQLVRLVPVEVALPQNIPEGYYLEGVEVIPKEAGVRGAEGDLAKVGALRVTPTVEELQSGKELLLPIKFTQSEPFDGNVTLEPPQVRVKGSLARGLPKKRVPVVARLSGQLDGDHEIQSSMTDPSEVLVEGPPELLEKVEAVETEAVDISTLSEGQAVLVPLRAPGVEGVSLAGTTSVKITIQLSEVKAVKTLTNIPLEAREAKEGSWTLSPSSVAVTLEGVPSKMESISPEAVGLRAYVDLLNIFVTPATLPVRTEIVSDDFSVVKIEPSTITVNAGNAEGGVGKYPNGYTW